LIRPGEGRERKWTKRVVQTCIKSPMGRVRVCGGEGLERWECDGGTPASRAWSGVRSVGGSRNRSRSCIPRGLPAQMWVRFTQTQALLGAGRGGSFRPGPSQRAVEVPIPPTGGRGRVTGDPKKVWVIFSAKKRGQILFPWLRPDPQGAGGTSPEGGSTPWPRRARSKGGEKITTFSLKKNSDPYHQP